MTRVQPKGAQTVLRAIDILSCFDGRDSALTLSEVARRVDLTLPTTHRLLRALESKDFLVFDQDSRRYALGSGVMRLAGVIMRRDDLIQVAAPSLERLHLSTTETVALYARLGDARVCVMELEGSHPIRMASGVGGSYPLHAGAAGKVLLGWADASLIAQATKSPRRLTTHTLTDRKSLLAELARVRQRGYAMSFGEVVPGASAIAVPILDSSGRAIAAINITGPDKRWTKTRMEHAMGALLREAKLIARRLGHAESASENGSRTPRSRATRAAGTRFRTLARSH